MVETFTNSLRQAEKNEDDCSHAAEGSNLKCALEAFAIPPAQTKSEKAAEPNAEKPAPIKDVPGATLSAEGNQYYMNYRGLHLPTWNSTNPDGSAAKPYVGTDGKVRNDGKLAAVTDEHGKVVGVDGKPAHGALGLRRVDKDGNTVSTKFDASEPAQMKAALEQVKGPLNDENRAAYNKMIESADKLDRVDMAKTIEANEKFVMSHTTAFLWDTALRQLAQKPGSEDALKAKEAELAQKPVLAEQVKRVREGSALDQELGQLMLSSVDSRAAYMNRLLNEDSVKKYMTSGDKQLENDTNVKEAKRVVAELSKLEPALTDKLRPTAKLLGVKN